MKDEIEMKKKIIVITGAGISAESGIKTFRDSDGLWEKYRIEDVATPEAWINNPSMVLDFYNQRRKDVLNAKPNAAHFALVKLEEYFEVTIITQNIDDLHERAGSKKVIHLHGEILKSKSSVDDDQRHDCIGEILMGDKCELGSQLRPHVVWFGEAVPMMEVAAKQTGDARIVLVIGTSLQVYPAAGLINYASYSAKKFLIDPIIPEVPRVNNLECIEAKATEGVPILVARLIKAFE
ncbi:MAG: NAD-dependent deacylase [Chitinophagales bacterium]|nr:NAD-dependent deacylase [Chitinophagales bacterium]